MDLMRQAHLVPVAITVMGGDTMVKEAWHHYKVPKRDLEGTMQVLLHTGRLKIAALPEAGTLVQELLAFQAHPSGARHL
jgi:hypothetical protein